MQWMNETCMCNETDNTKKAIQLKINLLIVTLFNYLSVWEKKLN